ncbi:type I restriction enzyme HsdR N-terminal domain-containing protein (plasmid) [Phaeobacter sp. BS23]|uniref:NACHT domain-containing protein n=1 Tax=Phaeobacter sp. BS23 TaxID=2907239 RepID=UPI0037043EE7
MTASEVGDIWSNISEQSASNEANVETWFVLPLLEALGHASLNIDSKVPILFQEGRGKRPGRKPEADFVVYAERPFSRSTSLIVVEAKHPDEALDGGKEQGESYAQNIRAPLLLLTNGKDNEIWQLQPSTESCLLLSFKTSELSQHRGSLESLLSPAALKAHCEILEHKNFGLAARDLSAYEQALHDRVASDARSAIERKLLESAGERFVRSHDLLDLGGAGAVVTGASGYGKTTLAASLTLEAIERRWEGTLNQLPISIFLPDYIHSGKSLDAFLADRIAAYKPGFTIAQLGDLARSVGLLIIADGFERLLSTKRLSVTSALRTMLQDQPHSRLFIMSRTQTVPEELNLPVVELCGYRPEELNLLAELRTNEGSSAPYAFTGAPDVVIRMAEVPLLADLLLKTFAKDQHFPNDLASLYDDWLKRILAASNAVDQAFDRRLLEDIASETLSGPVEIAKAKLLVGDRTDTTGILERLVNQGAISIRGMTVELQHEALADHLRAAQFWRSDTTESRERLNSLTFDPASQFAFLLIGAAPTADARRETWEAIARSDVRLAIQSLRFAGFDKPFKGTIKEADGLRMIEDIQSTIETLIDVHFEPIGGLLREQLAGQSIERLAVRGIVSADDISFAFFEGVGAAEQAVLLNNDEWSLAPKMFGHALRRMGFGPEAGRVLGLQRLQEAMLDLLESRRLVGGQVWKEERVFGRLRHLVRAYDFDFDPTGFEKAYPTIKAHAGQEVRKGDWRQKQEFPIDELLADMRDLLDLGVTRMPVWWADIDVLNLSEEGDRQQFAQTLDAYHRRRQIAYSEVVEHSFPAIRPHLHVLRTMPLRLEVEAEVHNRLGYERTTLHRKHWPAQNFEDAGADVSFPAQISSFGGNEDQGLYVERFDSLLRKFGRMFPERSISSGFGPPPDLRGDDTTFGGLPDESAVVRGTMDLLRNDLNNLFKELPSGRWQ